MRRGETPLPAYRHWTAKRAYEAIHQINMIYNPGGISLTGNWEGQLALAPVKSFANVCPTFVSNKAIWTNEKAVWVVQQYHHKRGWVGLFAGKLLEVRTFLMGYVSGLALAIPEAPSVVVLSDDALLAAQETEAAQPNVQKQNRLRAEQMKRRKNARAEAARKRRALLGEGFDDE